MNNISKQTLTDTTRTQLNLDTKFQMCFKRQAKHIINQITACIVFV